MLLSEVTSAEVAKALVPVTKSIGYNGSEIQRLRRVIEGDNGADFFNYGIKGAIEKVIRTDTEHDRRLVELERKWERFRWTLFGAALGGGVAGGGLATWITQALGV